MLIEKDIIRPNWENNKNVIACSCSNLYIPYLCVYLESLCSNINKKNLYDIVIVETDITKNNKKLLQSYFEKYPNVSLRFYNVDCLFGNIKLHLSTSYWAIQCYYRICIGLIFREYEKVLYSDIDLIVNFDINELFNIDMQGKAISACEEILWIPENRLNMNSTKMPSCDEYIKQKLGLDGKYYNTGVILVDVSKFNKIVSFEELFEEASSNRFINQEQDLLNKVFNGEFYTLPNNYNFEIHPLIYNSEYDFFNHYMEKIENGKIFHFLADKKAWFYPDIPKADLWWTYARQTPFYEEILKRMIDFNIKNYTFLDTPISKLRTEFCNVHFPNINSKLGNIEYKSNLLYVLDHILYYEFKMLCYKLKKTFYFGEKYDKYNKKYNKIKSLIEDAKNLSKELQII